VAEEIDTSVPQTARIWNYLLGGTDNFPVDRAVGDQIVESMPHLAEFARLSRRFHVRAVRWLAAEAGIRQFLDVGAGLPTAGNTHEVALEAAADSRTLYVDYDPMVITQGRALLAGSPPGSAAYILGDLRDPAAILREAAGVLDLGQPTALLLAGILGHIESDDEAKTLVDALMAGLPSGSYFLMYDGSDTQDDIREAARIWNLQANPKYHLRSPERIAALFDGLDLVDPGVVSVTRWRSDEDAPEVEQIGALARKP
jgi:hypothetical protein